MAEVSTRHRLLSVTGSTYEDRLICSASASTSNSGNVSKPQLLQQVAPSRSGYLRGSDKLQRDEIDEDSSTDRNHSADNR